MGNFSCQQGDFFIRSIRCPHRTLLGNPSPRNGFGKLVFPGVDPPTIDAPDAEVYLTYSTRRWTILRVGRRGAILKHQQHAPIHLPRGTYEVRFLVEFSPRYRWDSSDDWEWLK